MTLAAGVGTVTLDGAVGATTTLNAFTITGATIIQGSTVNTTGAVSYTGTTAIDLGGNITTAGAPVSMTGATALTANVAIDTTNAGGTAAGANITFSNTLNGAHTLTLTGGTGGTILLSGAVAARRLYQLDGYGRDHHAELNRQNDGCTELYGNKCDQPRWQCDDERRGGDHDRSHSHHGHHAHRYDQCGRHGDRC